MIENADTWAVSSHVRLYIPNSCPHTARSVLFSSMAGPCSLLNPLSLNILTPLPLWAPLGLCPFQPACSQLPFTSTPLSLDYKLPEGKVPAACILAHPTMLAQCLAFDTCSIIVSNGNQHWLLVLGLSFFPLKLTTHYRRWMLSSDSPHS